MRAAAVAVSLRGASSIARDTAQIIIMASSLDRISKLFEYARKARTSGKLSCSTIGITSVGCLVGGLAGMMGLGAILLTMQLGWLLGLAASYAPHLELAHQSIRKTPSPGNSR